MTKAQRLQAIREQIETATKRSGRAASSVQLIGVSKTKPAEDILEFLPLGLDQFGENYLKEALPKIASVNSSVQSSKKKPHWHFIGHLQSNKAKQIPGNFEWLHSLDSLTSAKALSSSALALDTVQKCLVQINIDEESSKGGILKDEVPKFLESLVPLTGIKIHGFMCIPNPNLEREKRIPFASLRTLMEKVNQMGCYSSPLRELSMGMSEDFDLAIQEGSSFVRIGTALFGERTQ